MVSLNRNPCLPIGWEMGLPSDFLSDKTLNGGNGDRS